MKKIKKRRQHRAQWHAFVIDAPEEIDPQEVNTLLLLMNPHKGELANFLPLPRPVQKADVIAAIEALYMELPLKERPTKITIMDKAYLKALSASDVLGSTQIVADHIPELEDEIREFLRTMPEPLSEGLPLGLGSRREELLTVSRRIYETRAWLHYMDEELLDFTVSGLSLGFPTVSVGDLAPNVGFMFLTSIEEIEALGEEVGEFHFDHFDLMLESEDLLDELTAESYRRKGWEVGPGLFPRLNLVLAGREETWITDPDQITSALRHLEVLATCLEDLAAKGYPPYPQLDGIEVRVGDETVTLGVSERAVLEYESEMMDLDEIDAEGPAKEILRIRAQLDNIEPPIYRTIEAPDHLTLAGLHGVIQRAFGWEDRHLWSFHYEGTDYALPQDDDPAALDEEDARDVTLRYLLGSEGQNLSYLYDFGDHWAHSLTIEARTAPEDGVHYPRLVDGARACPPEDIGGVPGYERMVEERASDPPEIFTWLEGYDPERFDPARVELPVAEVLNRKGFYEEAIPASAEAMLPQMKARLITLLPLLEERGLQDRLADADEDGIQELADELFELNLGLDFEHPDELSLMLRAIQDLYTML